MLVEIGALLDAEEEVAEALDDAPNDVEALNLFAKIKHIRGELSQAIACWATVYAHSPPIGATAIQLRSIMHLAMDPERGAGEFVALGMFETVRKPAAQLQLEEAFGFFLQRRTAEAIELCDRISRRYRGGDREMYKLAVIAKAWLAELSGDVELACTTLERLGEERSFETDVDRVLALVPLYQRIGTKAKLESAVHICRFLRSRHDMIAILSELAVLYRRLGDHAEAEQAESEYLVAFRRHMHRPSFDDVVSVAARGYVSLRELLRIHFASTSVAAWGTRLERALADALRGDRIGARATLGIPRGGLESKYAADLDLLSGDTDAAVCRYMACLTEDPDEKQIVFTLLDIAASAPTTELADYFRRPGSLIQTRRILESSIAKRPLEAHLWHRFATFLELVPGGAQEAAVCRRRADAQEAAARRRTRAIGRVLSAAVYYFVGQQKGLIHEVWATREIAPGGIGGMLPPELILGNLSAEMRVEVQNIFLSVREYAQVKFPHLVAELHDYRYTYKVTKEDEESHGVSAGLPTALAFLSVFLQWPIAQDVAFSGRIVTEAHDVLIVGPVGDVEHKVKGAYNRNLRKIVLPAANRPELVANPRIPNPILDDLVVFVSSLDEAVRTAFGDDVFDWRRSRPTDRRMIE